MIGARSTPHYLPSATPQRGRVGECPGCGIKDRTQHSLSQAGKCDYTKRQRREAEEAMRKAEIAALRKLVVVQA